MRTFKQFILNEATSSYSENLVNFIKAKEGFYEKAYWDYKQYTVGYGTKAQSANEVITREEADKRLREEINQAAQQVAEMLNKREINLTESQKEALISFTLNGGPGMTQQLLDSEGGRKTWEQISSAMRQYVKAGGKDLQGLKNRREAEILYANSGGTQGYDASQIAAGGGGEENQPSLAEIGQEDYPSMSTALAALLGAAGIIKKYTTGTESEGSTENPNQQPGTSAGT